MNYIETLKGKFVITEQGRNQIRSLLAWKGLALLSLTLDTGWNYQKLYRVIRGLQTISKDEFDKLDNCLFMLTGYRLTDTDSHLIGRVS